MPLSLAAAAHKDATSRATFEHRHFATIAAIIRSQASLDDCRDTVAEAFARELAATNPRFDRDRFLRACGVVE